MFFNQDNASVNICTVLKINRKSESRSSFERTHYTMTFRTKGEANFLIDGKLNRVEENHILIIPPQLQYSHETKGEELYAVHFESDLELCDEMKMYCVKNKGYFEHLFSELYMKWLKKLPGYNYSCKAVLYRIMALIENEYASDRYAKEDKISVAVEYIHEHFTDNDISVEKLADMCSMSDTYFRKLFKQRFSITPLKYINSLKLNLAKELINSGYYTVEEISEKCGFLNVGYFSLFIKKETGFSPSKYRIDK